MLTLPRYHGYAAAPTGRFDDYTGKGAPGCVGNAMEATFTLSLVAQLVVLGTSLAAIFTQNPIPAADQKDVSSIMGRSYLASRSPTSKAPSHTWSSRRRATPS